MTGMDFAELLDQAVRPQRTVKLCLRGDLVSRWEDLNAELVAAGKVSKSDSLASDGTAEVRAEMADLAQEMAPFIQEFVLTGLPREAFKALRRAHPPRTDAEGKVVAEDAKMDVNVDSYWPALTRACLTSPEVTGEQWKKLLGVLSDGQFSELASAALVVCRGTVDVPFFTAVSTGRRNSVNGSRRPNDSVSPSSDSTGGSLATP